MMAKNDRLTGYLKRRFTDSGIEALANLADYAGKSEAEKARLLRHALGESETEHARKMGADYHANGPNQINCHFTLFATRELSQAWEQGFKEAKQNKEERE